MHYYLEVQWLWLRSLSISMLFALLLSVLILPISCNQILLHRPTHFQVPEVPSRCKIVPLLLCMLFQNFLWKINENMISSNLLPRILEIIDFCFRFDFVMSLKTQHRIFIIFLLPRIYVKLILVNSSDSEFWL